METNEYLRLCLAAFLAVVREHNSDASLENGELTIAVRLLRDKRKFVAVETECPYCHKPYVMFEQDAAGNIRPSVACNCPERAEAVKIQEKNRAEMDSRYSMTGHEFGSRGSRR